jgi:hypothetical protein
MILQWVDDTYAALLADRGKPMSALEALRGTLEGLIAQDVATRSYAQIRFLLVTDEWAGAAQVARDALEICRGQVRDYLLTVGCASAFFAIESCDELRDLRDAVNREPGLTGTGLGRPGDRSGWALPGGSETCPREPYARSEPFRDLFVSAALRTLPCPPSVHPRK